MCSSFCSTLKKKREEEEQKRLIGKIRREEQIRLRIREEQIRLRIREEEEGNM